MTQQLIISFNDFVGGCYKYINYFPNQAKEYFLGSKGELQIKHTSLIHGQTLEKKTPFFIWGSFQIQHGGIELTIMTELVIKLKQ